MTILLVVCALLLGYTYFGYPALLALRRRMRPRPVRSANVRLRLSIIIPARDEARVIARKIESILAQDYPRELYEILVVDDGSRDGTAPIARSFGLRVRVLRLEEPAGKPAALNLAVAHARGEILVLTDARQPLLPGALPALAARFADPSVGAATGEIAVSGGGPLGFYRRYDDWIRRAEADCDSAIGVTGALWALRRECFTPLPPETLADDLFLPMMVVAQRRRVVYAKEARALDSLPHDPRADFRRRVRTLAGNFQLLSRAPWLLLPLRNPAFGSFVSHKVLRLATPALMAGLLLSSLAHQGVLPALVLAAQVLLYGLALAGCFADGVHGAIAAAARGALAFVMINAAIVKAAISIARGREGELWRPAPQRIAP